MFIKFFFNNKFYYIQNILYKAIKVQLTIFNHNPHSQMANTEEFGVNLLVTLKNL